MTFFLNIEMQSSTCSEGYRLHTGKRKLYARNNIVQFLAYHGAVTNNVLAYTNEDQVICKKRAWFVWVSRAGERVLGSGSSPPWIVSKGMLTNWRGSPGELQNTLSEWKVWGCRGVCLWVRQKGLSAEVGKCLQVQNLRVFLHASHHLEPKLARWVLVVSSMVWAIYLERFLERQNRGKS